MILTATDYFWGVIIWGLVMVTVGAIAVTRFLSTRRNRQTVADQIALAKAVYAGDEDARRLLAPILQPSGHQFEPDAEMRRLVRRLMDGEISEHQLRAEAAQLLAAYPKLGAGRVAPEFYRDWERFRSEAGIPRWTARQKYGAENEARICRCLLGRCAFAEGDDISHGEAPIQCRRALRGFDA